MTNKKVDALLGYCYFAINSLYLKVVRDEPCPDGTTQLFEGCCADDDGCTCCFGAGTPGGGAAGNSSEDCTGCRASGCSRGGEGAGCGSGAGDALPTALAAHFGSNGRL